MADNQAEALKEKEAGNAFYKNKEYEEAMAAYGRAIALAPESETAALCYSNRSAVFQIQKKFAKAEKDALACLAIKPDFVRGYIRLALAQRKQGKYDDARSSVQDGLKRQPEDKDLLKALQQIDNAQQKNQAKAGAAAQAEKQARLQAVKRELDALQDKKSLLAGRYAETAMSINGISAGAKRSAMTFEQISQLPEETPTFLTVGRMYLRHDMADTKAFLEEKVEAANGKLAQLEKKATYLKGATEEVDKEIMALIDSVQ